MYKIFKGVDYGSISIKGQCIFENFIGEYNTKNGALYEYEKVKRVVKAESNKQGNENYRYFCYMIFINQLKHLIGIHKEDNGYDSVTLYSHSYFKNKNIETFKEIKNIEDGKVIW